MRKIKEKKKSKHDEKNNKTERLSNIKCLADVDSFEK